MKKHIGALAVSDTGFVFDPHTGNTYAVNTTGLAVLRGLKDGRTLREIEDDLGNEFEPAAGVDDHLRQFAQLLIDMGLMPESELIR